MSSSELHSTHLRHLLQRLQQNDRAAADELLRRTGARLERLARQMLHGYPRVRAHEQTADVLQEAVLSLLAALRGVEIRSTRDFYGLAAEHIRRRLLDLARRHGRGGTQPLDPAALPDPAAADDLERWAELHEAAEQLPGELREVFGLRFYHGWSWVAVAEALGISESTARRRWLAALVRLEERLGERLP